MVGRLTPLAARWRTAKLPEEISLETALTFRSVSFKEAAKSGGRDSERELSSTKLKTSSHMVLALRRGAPELTDTTNAVTEAASWVRNDGQPGSGSGRGLGGGGLARLHGRTIGLERIFGVTTFELG